VGGLVGALIGLGMPEYEAKRYGRPNPSRRHLDVRPLRQSRLGKTR
jgi:hypothetical protein